MNHRFVVFAVCLLSIAGFSDAAEPIFLEAETAFTASSDGWKIQENHQTRSASSLKTLNGAGGDKTGTASAPVKITAAGDYRIWVRHNYHADRKGPFTLTVTKNDKAISEKTFDLGAREGVKDWLYVWDFVDVSLAPGNHQLTLTKHENQNCSGYVRNVDCLLITTDKDTEPNHLEHGPQTWMRVTLGDVYEKPVQVHIFADHYRAPWYGHWHLSKAGTVNGLRYIKANALQNGESSPWCNITPMLYQDTGAILNITARHTYYNQADRLQAKFEFATAADENSIVRTMHIDAEPNGLIVVMPPNLVSEENLDRFKIDREFAEATGKIADAYDWPTIGKKPEKIPFYISATVGGYSTPVDQEIMDREWKTLDYFGFSNRDPDKPTLHGKIWLGKNQSFCQPDVEKMRANAAVHAQHFAESGKKIEDVTFCMLTDEPTGQPSEFMVKDPAYHAAFRAWLKGKLGKTPADLLVENWDQVVPVLESERDDHPALHYFTQQFRTRALGDFMATQREILAEAYGRDDIPTLVNFSDGAVYTANLYSQGVDYFELLDSDDQNAIWSEDWSNGASSYQCAAFNVDLMRAAARDREQTLGHFLIAYAGRKGWDIKTKAASETARGIRIWQAYSYGVPWGTHAGGPTWDNHTIYSTPEIWDDLSEVVREIGGAEDLLVDAEPLPAEVALLYSSSTDIWTMKKNFAYGFDRMHTWMALAHAQIPVDILSERQIERGALDDYKVAYLSGPNLTRAAAEKLAAWVNAGGILHLSAGAASRDEFNRPLTTLNHLIPATRGPVEPHQAFVNSGSYVHILKPSNTVTAGDQELEVLSVSQKQTAKPGAETLATFADGSPATVFAAAGKGRIVSHSYLPALPYIKQALEGRRYLQEISDTDPAEQSEHPAPPVVLSDQQGTEYLVGDDPRLARSANPWHFPEKIRELILAPVRAANLDPPLICDVPLIDAIPLYNDRGIVIPLANHTLDPQKSLTLRVRLPTDRSCDRVTSIHQEDLKFTVEGKHYIRFTLPLDASDYVKIYFSPPR
jgi:hypothetical protein